MKLIELKCKNCGAKLEVNSELDKFTCNFCGTENFIDDEAAELRRVEDVKLKARQKNHEQTLKEQKDYDDIEYHNSFKKSKLKKWVIFILVCAILFTFVAFGNRMIGTVIVGIIQIALLIASLLFGLNIIKEPFKYCHRILAYVAFGLIFVFMLTMNSNNRLSNKCENFKWNNIYLKEIVPEPNKTKGEVHSNTRDDLWIDLCEASMDDFYDYKDKLNKVGFSIDEDISTTSYQAFNSEGYKVRLYYTDYDNELSINIDAPEKYEDISWPTVGLATKLPKPKSNVGKIINDNSEKFYADISKTTKSDYNEYVNECQNKGFNIEYTKEDSYYKAKNKDGYELFVKYEGANVMNIEISIPEEEKEEPKKDDSKKEEPKEEPKKDDSKKEEETKKYEHTLGDTVQFDGLEITFDKKYSFTKLKNQFSEYNGKSVIKLGVTVKNVTSKKHSLNMFYYESFGSKGVELENVSFYFDNSVDFAGELKPGASYKSYFYVLYDGDGKYSIDFENFTEEVSVEFDIKK